MTFKNVKYKIENFLKDFKEDSPKILAVKGKWGVGKTHLVKEVVGKSKDDIAYISLFGINSLNELKEQILGRLLANRMTNGEGSGQLISDVIAELTGNTGKVGIVGRIAKNIVMTHDFERTVVVLDDLERHGDGLRLQDVLGYSSYLGEEKKWKVIFILNETELEGERQELDRYREKVIDREIELAPTPDEIIEKGKLADNDIAVTTLQKLGVDNIRAVKKIKDFLERLEPLLANHREIRDKMTRSAVVLGWFYFVRNTEIVSFDFIKELDSSKIYLNRNEEESEFVQQLASYGYRTTGPLEKLLIKALETGFDDETEFFNIFSELSPKILEDKAKQLLRNADDLLHGTLENNEDDYIKAIIRCFEENSGYYSPNTLEFYWNVLTSLGHSDNAEKIIDVYFDTEHNFEPHYEYTDFKRLQNLEIKRRVSELLRKQYEEIPMLEVIKTLTRGKGDFPRYFDTASYYSESDWYNLLKTEFNGKDFGWYDIHKILKRGILPEYKVTATTLARALERISQESKINSHRVSDYGEEIEAVLDQE